MRRVAGAALLVAATLAAYWPALGGGFIWDDDAHVTQNLALRSPAGLRTIWFEPGLLPSAKTPDAFTPTQYYPLLHTTFWLEYRLWGLRPFGYHLVNVLLHAAVALLAWAVLRRLRVPGAALAAAVFALHPVHVESVAWITERKNLVSGALYLGAMLAYLRFSPPEEDGPRPDRRGAYALSLLLFAGALLSKTVTVTLPAALALVQWWKRGRLSRDELRALAPMAMLGAGLAAVTVAIEKLVAGAGGAEWQLSVLQRCLIAARALCFYVAKLAWPARQAFVYPQWQVDPRAAGQWVYPLIVLAALAAAWMLRHRFGRGPLAALLFFAGTLLPALGFIDYYTMRFSYVADHYQYLASLGPIALACAAGTHALRSPRARRAGMVAAVLVLAALGTLTWRRAHVFRSNEALWRDTLAKNPDCWMALNNLGLELQESGRLDEGVALLREAIRVRPDYAVGRFNLALALERQGHAEEAIEQLQVLLRDEKRYGELHYHIGVQRAAQGRMEEAIGRYRRALELFPTRPEVHDSLASALVAIGRRQEALEHYRLALRYDPRLVDAHYNLGLLAAEDGRTDEARAHLLRARELAASQGNTELVCWIQSRIDALPPPRPRG